MDGTSTFLSALAELHTLDSADERRLIWRQGLAALVTAAEREPAPLEGLDPAALLATVRVALSDDLLVDLDWMSPGGAAIALFCLGGALPSGAERRELGRRVVGRLRDGDHDTFVALATSLALSSPRALDNAAARARIEVALSAPLASPGGVGSLALALIARADLAERWLRRPAMGSLPDRRLAARLLAHAARAAVSRAAVGDDDAVDLLSTPLIDATLARLITDREALVWRFAAIARGLLAHARPDLASAIDHELGAGGSPDLLRRAATSAAAALERGGVASRWRVSLIDRARVDGGAARAVVQGLAGLAATDAGAADTIAAQMVVYGGLDAIDSIVELWREEGTIELPETTAAARAWIDRALTGDDGSDDGRLALLLALRSELGGAAAPDDVFASALTSVRARLEAGDPVSALAFARAALDELAAAIEWLERASDDDALDRRHALRVLRELDRTFLSDGTVPGVLTLAGEGDPAAARLAKLLVELERVLLQRELSAETRGAVPHYRLRLARLRALVRLLDGQIATLDDPTRRDQRLLSTRALMTRARLDVSPLRRAVWAALTRSWDAMIRQEDAEVTDLLFALTSEFDPDEDFAIVREATMQPVVEAVIDAYVRLNGAMWAAADPDDINSLVAALEAMHALARALPRGTSPRVESVRSVLAAMTRTLRPLAEATGRSELDLTLIDTLADQVSALGRRQAGARRRLGLPISHHAGVADSVRAVARAIERQQQGDSDGADSEIAVAADVIRDLLPPAIAGVIGRVLIRLARLPAEGRARTTAARESVLPGWLPLSRILGGFYIQRAIGNGAGGSVFVAVRADERGQADAKKVALKVPDYDGGAARSLSETEFEAMFREEAGALLAIPSHPNLSGFVTFDAGARPKPILVMELVMGPTLERALELGSFDLLRAFAVVDGIGAGLESMHKAGVAHLDVKPQNVILRPGDVQMPVLVDFGLAGRHLRPGCGSPHYGAPEVWTSQVTTTAPFATDAYAYAALAFEILTGNVLVEGSSLQLVLGVHRRGEAATLARSAFENTPALAPLAELFVAALALDPAKRPTVARLRAGFSAIAPDLAAMGWPLRG